jgi:hypothetical protein
MLKCDPISQLLEYIHIHTYLIIKRSKRQRIPCLNLRARIQNKKC